jgi:hypothetical protein
MCRRGRDKGEGLVFLQPDIRETQKAWMEILLGPHYPTEFFTPMG